MAVFNNYTEIVKILIDAECDLDVFDEVSTHCNLTENISKTESQFVQDQIAFS